MKSHRDFILFQAQSSGSVDFARCRHPHRDFILWTAAMHAAFALAALLLFAAPAMAAPALWHVTGPEGDVVLFGSIHILPPDIRWRTPAIERAMADADVFVFETPADGAAMTRMQQLVAAHGRLPQGASLRALLPPAARTDYDAALEAAHLAPAAIDREQPWLADLHLLLAQSEREHFSPDAGVDRQIMALAQARHREIRYFETIDQQFALLAPSDDDLQLEEFESDLKDYRKPDTDLDALVAAWARGDVAAIDRLMNGELADFPAAKQALLTDRNRRWALQIETMLHEKRRFFVTVGAAHLAGADGVPALLRKAGYHVTGS